MIVQCEHCQTKYRIADEKVKGKGVKVRCAKCENVFTVTPQEGNGQPAAPEPPAPPPTPPESQEPEEKPPDLPGSTPAGTGPAPSAVGEQESASREEPPAGLSPLPPLGSPPEKASAPEEDRPSPAPHTEDQPPGEWGAPAPDEPELDTGSQRPAHEMDQGGLSSPPPSTPVSPEDGGFVIEGTLREDPPTGSDPFAESSGEAGGAVREQDPDAEWGNIAIGDQAQEEPTGGDLGLSGSPQYTPPPPVPSEEPEPPTPGPLGDAPAESPPVPARDPQAKTGGSARKGLSVLLLLALLGAGGYFAYPTVMGMIQSRGQEAQGTLTPANIQVKALTRVDGKIVYSVRGEVRNDSPGNVGMVQVEAQFRNVSGDVLSKTTSYCGNLFDDRDLANLDLERIRSDLKNELGQSLSNASIPPGGSVPFLLVLDSPPSGVSKVTVTILSFKETT